MTTETETTESTTTDTVRAWVGCLGCYNNGDLVGSWLDADDCGDLVAAGLARFMEYDHEYSSGVFCTRCGSDEFWIFDHEGLPAAVLSGECSPCQFAEVATAWELVDDPDMVAAYLGNMGETVTAENLAKLAESAAEAYTGYATVIEYAESYLEDSGLLAEVPETLRYYIDVEAFARDLELGGDVSEVDGYVFRNC
jgi:antirestriction protein